MGKVKHCTYCNAHHNQETRFWEDGGQPVIEMKPCEKKQNYFSFMRIIVPKKHHEQEIIIQSILI